MNRIKYQSEFSIFSLRCFVQIIRKSKVRTPDLPGTASCLFRKITESLIFISPHICLIFGVLKVLKAKVSLGHSGGAVLHGSDFQ